MSAADAAFYDRVASLDETEHPETPAFNTVVVPVDRIHVGERCRWDLGDIDALKASIEHVGLLNPVTLDRDFNLLAGHRRLEAAKRLGWDEIDARVTTGALSLLQALEHERDENVCRKDFTPSEAHALAVMIREAIEGPAAKQRQGKRTDLTPAEPPENFSRSSGRAKDRAAEHTGYSRPTLDKVEKVIETERDESQPDEVRKIARQAHEDMDRTGKVDPAYRKVVDAKNEASNEKAAELLGEDEVAKVKAAKLRANYHKCHVQLTSGLLQLSPEHVARVLDEDLWRGIEQTREGVDDWFDRLFAARPKPFSVIDGGQG